MQPARPWESGSLNRLPPQINPLGRRLVPGGIPQLYSSSPAAPVRGPVSVHPQASTTPSRPPPLPKRAPGNTTLNQTTGLTSRLPLGYTASPYGSLTGGYGSYGGYGGYGSYSGYGGYGGYSGYGGYGGFGSMGGYGGMNSYMGYGMNRYGTPNPNDPESRFIRLAEESSSPAFESIQSLVQAFHSVSMMLDSTFGAVYTSFRAVLGVAENFGRLRSLLGQFFSSVALFRAFIWLYKKVLYLLGLRRENPSHDQMWQDAMQAAGEDFATATGRPRSSWPILMFMGIVFSGPYLIFKLMSSLSSSVHYTETAQKTTPWNPDLMPGTATTAMYGFSARSDDELSFYPGQRVVIAPATFQRRELQGWLLAKVEGSPQIGLVPFNYLTAAAQNTVSSVPDVSKEGDPMSQNVGNPVSDCESTPLSEELKETLVVEPNLEENPPPFPQSSQD